MYSTSLFMLLNGCSACHLVLLSETFETKKLKKKEENKTKTKIVKPHNIPAT